MTLLSLVNHCYENGVRVSFEYDAVTDSIRIDTYDRKEALRHYNLVDMSNILDCKNPELLISSYINDGVESIKEMNKKIIKKEEEKRHVPEKSIGRVKESSSKI